MGFLFSFCFYRYKPFFVKTDPGQLEYEDNEIVPQGQLDVTCVEVTRLSVTTDIINIYYTFTVGPLQFYFYNI